VQRLVVEVTTMTTPKDAKEALEEIVRRPRWRRGEARVVVEAARCSGLSLREFAAVHAIEAHRLYRWNRAVGAAADVVEFTEVRLSSAPPVPIDERIEVELRTGERVRVGSSFDADALRRLLAVLDHRSC
jgi:hypothetical protein